MRRIRRQRLTAAFKDFFENERSGAIVLIACTAASLLAANSAFGDRYLGFWHASVGPLSVEHWINDGLMAVFFLLIGLELERELYVGELSTLKDALLPIFAALGGVVLPALIHFGFNLGTPEQAGVGIPMATDIAFAVGVLALLGNRVPASLKVFLVALAVMDDLCAIVVIAVFYTAQVSLLYLLLAATVLGGLVVLNRLRIMSLVPYLIGGAALWYFMLRSGVHATIAGVLTAFTVPFAHKKHEQAAPSERLENFLHEPVAFLILPVFALANTGVVIGPDWASGLMTRNSLGIISGLVIGKPIGIMLASFAVVTLGICRLPLDLTWKHVFGAGLLGGIGFTMSIFITNLAFTGLAEIINASKMAILFASLTAGTIGFIWLRILGAPEP
ncbi:MAG TPA: Na+/H+ antiporter NhaA, partial [Pyrinomonadaceae bacterium]|nr:Na+/H+ antiporter NhaA [Pyrinomonadaceae bacterium]